VPWGVAELEATDAPVRGRWRRFLAGLGWLTVVAVGVWATMAGRGLAPAAPAPPDSPAAYDWAMYGGSLDNSFANANPGRIDAARVGLMVPAWRLEADGVVAGDPIVVGDRVFFGTWGGSLYAVDRASGRVVWRDAVGPGRRVVDWGTGSFTGSALYDGGRLFAVTMGGVVLCLDPGDGRILWRSAPLFPETVPDAVWSSLHAYDGVLFVGIGGSGSSPGERGGAAALDELTGKVLWTRSLVAFSGGGGAGVWPTPAVAPELGLIFVGTGNPLPYPGNPGGSGPVPPGPDPYTDSVVALDRTDGHIVWYFQTHPHDGEDLDFLASVNLFRLPDGRLAAGDGEKDGVYYVFDARTGRPVWRRDLGRSGAKTMITGTAAVSGGRIFVGTMEVPDGVTPWPEAGLPPAEGHLFALDAATGRVLWKRAMPAAVMAAPAVARDVVFAVAADGTVRAFATATGRPLWSAKAGDRVWKGGITVAGDMLLVPLADPGGVAAFTLPRE
jgi:outer membrane protein assembly factor BamB